MLKDTSKTQAKTTTDNSSDLCLSLQVQMKHEDKPQPIYLCVRQHPEASPSDSAACLKKMASDICGVTNSGKVSSGTKTLVPFHDTGWFTMMVYYIFFIMVYCDPYKFG